MCISPGALCCCCAHPFPTHTTGTTVWVCLGDHRWVYCSKYTMIYSRDWTVMCIKAYVDKRQPSSTKACYLSTTSPFLHPSSHLPPNITHLFCIAILPDVPPSSSSDQIAVSGALWQPVQLLMMSFHSWPENVKSHILQLFFLIPPFTPCGENPSQSRGDGRRETGGKVSVFIHKPLPVRVRDCSPCDLGCPHAQSKQKVRSCDQPERHNNVLGTVKARGYFITVVTFLLPDSTFSYLSTTRRSMFSLCKRGMVSFFPFIFFNFSLR